MLIWKPRNVCCVTMSGCRLFPTEQGMAVPAQPSPSLRSLPFVDQGASFLGGSDVGGWGVGEQYACLWVWVLEAWLLGESLASVLGTLGAGRPQHWAPLGSSWWSGGPRANEARNHCAAVWGACIIMIQENEYGVRWPCPRPHLSPWDTPCYM